MATREIVECDVCGKTEDARPRKTRPGWDVGGPYPTGWRRTAALTSGLKDSYASAWTCSIKCAQDWLAQKG